MRVGFVPPVSLGAPSAVSALTCVCCFVFFGEEGGGGGTEPAGATSVFDVHFGSVNSRCHGALPARCQFSRVIFLPLPPLIPFVFLIHFFVLKGSGTDP